MVLFIFVFNLPDFLTLSVICPTEAQEMGRDSVVKYF